MALIALGVLIAPMLVAMGIMSKYPHLQTDGAGAALTLASLAVGLLVVALTLWPLTLYSMRIDAARDRKRIAPEYQVGTLVGVSYAPEAWALRGESAWDRGWLQSSPAGLTFHGYASSFALPRETIRSVKVHDVQTPVGKLAAVRLEWVHGDELSDIILEPRECRSRKEMHRLCEDLRTKIEAGNDPNERANLPLPMATSSLKLDQIPDLSKASGTDKAIAMALAFLALLAAVALYTAVTTLLGFKKPPGIGGFGVLILGFYGLILTRRIKRKGPDAGPEG